MDGGFPMDVRFLDLIKLSEQWYRHAPFPLYDVSSIMMTAGSDPREDREEYAKELIGEKKGRAYDPAWKAEVSGLCAIRALRKLQTMHRKG